MIRPSSRALRWALAGAVAIALVLATASWWLAGSLVAPVNHAVVLPQDFGATKVSIPGRGHAIAGSWKDIGRDTPIILLLHGIRSDRSAMLSHARLLIGSGFSVLMIDLQAHGETPGNQITLGWRESADVQAAREWIRLQAPGRRIGVVGVSLGGASVLLGPQPCGFDAVVLESVYPRITRAVQNRLRMRLGPPGEWLAPFLLMQIGPRLGVIADQLEPVRHVAALEAPVLVVGGSLDEHTTPAETLELFEAARAPKELWIVDGARHIDLARFDPAGYDRHVVDFLRRRLVP